MVHWHAINVRVEQLNAAQRWAQLEAKSPLMREELARRYATHNPARRQIFANATFACELIVITLKAWWHISS